MSNNNPTTKSSSAETESFIELSEGFLVGGGRYSLSQSLGQGGMGVVWLARDERLGQMVALKFVQLQSNPMVLDDLRRETARSLKLTHPNIIRIFDFYEAPGDVAFISMEYVDGANLHSMRAQQLNEVFSWSFLKPIIKQLCDALDYAHGENVIHRDLKPGNMMVDGKWRLKLADFGIAAAISDPLQAYYQRHAASGTLTHMSPQQMAGKPATVADDIYALGATLYDLLTGTPPFQGEDIPEQAINNLAEPISIRLAKLKLPNEVPPHVAAMIMACLSKDPALRPPSAHAVAEWIGFESPITGRSGPIVVTTMADKPILEHKTKSIAIPPSPVAARPVEKTVELPTQLPEPEKIPAKKIATWAGGAVLALIILGAFGWLIGRAVFKSDPVISTVPDGSATLDKNFQNSKIAIDNFVRTIALHPSGKIVMGGAFQNVGGIEAKGIAVLNVDGSLDKNFVASVNSMVHCVTVQKDGKIILGGDFTDVSGQACKSIARLLPDGTVDGTFRLWTDTEGSLRSVIVQPDGKIIIAGQFTQFHGAPKDRIARLTADGNLDETFVAGVNSVVWATVLQPDEKILLGGNFTLANAVKCNRIARFTADGQLDRDFNPGSGANGLVYAIALQEDGRIVIGGNFTEFNGRPRNRVARLDSDGSLDETFTPGAGPDSGVRTLAIQEDQKILLGGVFKYFNDTPLNHLARLNENGSVDLSFAPGKGFDDTVRDLAIQDDGMILVAGHFANYNSRASSRIARLKGAAAKK